MELLQLRGAQPEDEAALRVDLLQLEYGQRYSHLSNETLLAAVDASANAAGSGWGQAQMAKAGDNLVLVAA